MPGVLKVARAYSTNTFDGLSSPKEAAAAASQDESVPAANSALL